MENLLTSWTETAMDLGPGRHALLLGLATLVQEDVPTLAAAALAGAGKLPLGWAAAGCLLGIWIGDLLLYGAARVFGRRVLDLPWVRTRVSTEAVARSERWFAQEGTWLLVSSRFVPGTRLPTYLAAGFLRVPFARFAGVTGAVVAVWVALLFVLVLRFGSPAVSWVTEAGGGSWAAWGVPAVVAGAWLVWRAGRRRREGRRSCWRDTVERWRRWEFWPAWLFYLPVAGQILRLMIRHRSVMLPTAANPGILTGGLVGESKYETLRELRERFPEFTAPTWRLEPGNALARLRRLQELLEHREVALPLVLKPDLGQRGLGVRVIRSLDDAHRYVLRTDAALVVQPFIAGPREAGVFYCRFPDEARGRILSLTEKIFPEVVGDGTRTLEALIRADPRARLIAGRYLARFGGRLGDIVPEGVAVRLVQAGNHAQGCIFRDGSRWWTPALEARVDEIARGIRGFSIGRFDVRFASEDAFREGEGFQILELNGAAAEVTHIYDERMPLRTAYRSLFRQWELVFALGAAHRDRGVPVMTMREFLRHWRAARRCFATYPPAD